MLDLKNFENFHSTHCSDCQIGPLDEVPIDKILTFIVPMIKFSCSFFFLGGPRWHKMSLNLILGKKTSHLQNVSHLSEMSKLVPSSDWYSCHRAKEIVIGLAIAKLLDNSRCRNIFSKLAVRKFPKAEEGSRKENWCSIWIPNLGFENLTQPIVFA